jgi:hypothetical protein
LVAGEYVTYREDPDVAHVKPAAGVRKHRQAVKLVLPGVFTNLKTAGIIPVFLGLTL